MNTELRERYEKKLADFVRRHQLACDELTEAQMASVIRQVLECGDLIKQVRVTDGAQSVIYVPYSEVDRLRAMHNELIMAVAKKFEGETRHETALRYIREREERESGGPAQEETRPITAEKAEAIRQRFEGRWTVGGPSQEASA